MNLLLDTHIFIWLLSDIQQIPENILTACKNSNNRLYISVVNSWEMQIKIQQGKLSLPVSRSKLIEQSQQHGFSLLSITENHINHLEALKNHHKDPFDRLLMAQANAEKMKLISADSKIYLYKDQVDLLW